MAELADAIDLGSIPKGWGFKSLYPHQESPTRTVKVLVGFFLCIFLNLFHYIFCRFVGSLCHSPAGASRIKNFLVVS